MPLTRRQPLDSFDLGARRTLGHSGLVDSVRSIDGPANHGQAEAAASIATTGGIVMTNDWIAEDVMRTAAYLPVGRP